MNKQEIINRVKEKSLMGMCDTFIDGFMVTDNVTHTEGTGKQSDVIARFQKGYGLLKQACHKLDDLLDDD
jgi:hypothetical protein